jgi:CRP/FNR family transcriptional regulator, cyclic AMP receptor protein
MRQTGWAQQTPRGVRMGPTGELWEGLSPDERQQAARYCPDRSFPKGSTIFAPGDAPEALYVLRSGLVKLSHVSEDGQESILRVFGPGDVFGELLLTVTARPFLATALTPCVATVIPGKTFLQLLGTNPRIGFNFIGVLSRHLAEMALDRGQASHKWSFQRLALTLLKLSKAHGEEEKGSTSIALPLTHQILADMIGASRETVTRHLGRFSHLGAVTQRGRNFLIQEARLKALLPG